VAFSEREQFSRFLCSQKRPLCVCGRRAFEGFTAGLFTMCVRPDTCTPPLVDQDLQMPNRWAENECPNIGSFFPSPFLSFGEGSRVRKIGHSPEFEVALQRDGHLVSYLGNGRVKFLSNFTPPFCFLGGGTFIWIAYVGGLGVDSSSDWD